MLNKIYKNTVVTLTLTAAGLSGGTAIAAGDAARGENLAQTCNGCHAGEGYRNPSPVYNIPKIGGQHADYIVTALKAYRSKERSHGTMQAQAASLSDQDMQDIAAYYAAMNGNSKPILVNADLAKLGKEKSATCATCHGATGNGDQPGFPKLAGQYDSYIVQALKDYRAAAQTQGKEGRNNAVMTGFASGLSIDDIEALAAWYASQEGDLSAPRPKLFK